MIENENNWSITDVYDNEGNLYSVIGVNQYHNVSEGEEISLTDLERDHNICQDDLDCYNETDLIFLYIAKEDCNQKNELLIRTTGRITTSPDIYIHLILIHPDTGSGEKRIRKTREKVSSAK